MRKTSKTAGLSRPPIGAALAVAGRKPWLTALAAAVILALLVSVFWERRTVPVPEAPARYLDDRAGMVSPQFAAAKNQYLEYLSRTARIAQINIVILPHAPSADIEDFSISAASAWKIGAGGVDNGLALFVFRDERKLRLEVGYGLESVITDADASHLLTQVVVPAFGRGQFEAGIEDFLHVLNKTLESSEAASRRAAQSIEFIPSVLKVLRIAPTVGRKAWHGFVLADIQGRFVISLFGLILLGLATYAMACIAAAVPAIVMLPWRVYGSPTLRGATLSAIGEQFSPRNFLARPPPFLVGVVDDLRLGAIVNAAYMVAGIAVGLALLSVGSGLFMDGLGKFGGAGATISWPA